MNNTISLPGPVQKMLANYGFLRVILLHRAAGVMALLVTIFLLTCNGEILAEESTLLSDTRQLTFEGRRAGEGYFSNDGNLMIFQSERDPLNPFYQIYLLDLETGDVERVSPGLGKTTCAWIHPDRNRVLFASTHDDPQAARKTQAELEFRASGKQRRYSWDYDEHFEIYQHDLKTGNRRNLTNTPGYDAEGAYSPDGRQIVFASNRRAYSGEMTPAERAVFEHDKSFMMDLYLMNADGSNLRRLTSSPGYDGGPFFSADGRSITWRRFSEDGSQAEIFVMDLASGEERQLTRMGVMSWAPFFHPSGEYLIFASNREGFANFELYLVDAAGRQEPVRVTFTQGFDGLPVFSPDGSKLSWTSNRTAGKQSQIFLSEWDHEQAMRLLGLDRSKSTQKTAGRLELEATGSAISNRDIRQYVQRLTADDMAGRLTGTEGEKLATAYVAAVFRHLGLLPAGDEGSYFQSFSFTAGAEPGQGNRLAFEGPLADQTPELGRDWVPLALSRNGEVEPSAVVFAGYGIVAPGAGKIPDYDAYGDLEVKDKWVMVFRYQPESVPADWRRHLLHYSDLGYKASLAKQRGAKGLLVVRGPTAADSKELIEMKLDANSATTSVAGISISDDLARRLLETADQDILRLQQRLDQGKPETGFVLPGIRVGAEIDVSRIARQGRNVIARLGSDQTAAEPLLILGAHVDHLGRGETSGSLAGEGERGEIHHGADDNASGVAALLEIAQYLATLNQQGKLDTKRDIYFAAWSGEELGTLGSSHFVGQMAGGGSLHDKVSAYLNMDMVGHLRDSLYLQGTGSSKQWLREIERRNIPVGLRIATKDDPYLPTDTTPFYLQGVPVLNAFTGAHEDYSTPRDIADKLNYEGIRNIARLMAGIARSLAIDAEEPDYQEVSRSKGGLSRKHLRAYLGTIPAYGQDEKVKGVKLQGAVKDAPADRAGVRKGDLLIGLSDMKIETIHDFMNALAGLKVGEQTSILLLREGEKVELKVTPVSRD